jgi:lactobin A/cerein 7B family class IIb bacteriocin
LTGQVNKQQPKLILRRIIMNELFNIDGVVALDNNELHEVEGGALLAAAVLIIIIFGLATAAN